MAQDSLLITVVILNWNGKNWLEQFLPSVLQSSFRQMSVLVVDNGSTDDSVAWLKKTYADQVDVLELPENYGFAEGNNKALPHIQTPYFILLNSDVEVSPGWIEPMLREMEAHPAVAAIQPKVKLWADKSLFEYAGGAGGWIDRYGYAFCRGRVFDVLETDTGQYDDPEDCLWATGACMMLRTSVVQEIGLFHGELFAHWEEIDFCWRAWNKGYRIRVAPESEVFHVGGGTLPQGNPRKTFLNVRNSLICLFLNLPDRGRWRHLFIRMILDGVWGAKSLLSGDAKTVSAIIRAHWAFFGQLSLWKNKRKALYPKGVATLPSAGIWNGSLIWAHFVKGKKYFGEIAGGE